MVMIGIPEHGLDTQMVTEETEGLVLPWSTQTLHGSLNCLTPKSQSAPLNFRVHL